MSEHSQHSSDNINEKVDQIKGTILEQGEPILNAVVETHEKVDLFKVVQTVALVGILLTNRKMLKLSKHVIKQNDKNIVKTANFIKELKDAGRTFEFFPGVGLWVE